MKCETMVNTHPRKNWFLLYCIQRLTV
uniref:Uncharacterized protein n=1 Tax=Arundo donax TaxID=35708 RepID=A0A0A9AY42_ARUDO